MSPIKDLRTDIPRFKRLGVINLGDPKEEGRVGRATPYFQFRRALELKAFYPEKPTKLNVFFPFDDIDRNIDDAHRLYGAGSIKCRGDGELIEVCIKEARFVVSNGECQVAFEENGKHFEPGDLVECGGFRKIYPKCEDCTPRAYLRVMIQEVMEEGRLGYYQIATGSKHGILNVRGGLEIARDLVERLTGKPYLAGIPFILSLEIQPISTPRVDKQTGEGYRVRAAKPILTIEPQPEWVRAQIQALRHQMLPELADGPAPALLAGPTEVVKIVPADSSEVDDPKGPERPEAHIQETTRVERPADPETVRGWLCQKAHLKGALMEPSSKQLGLMVGTLEKILGGDDADKKRPSVLYYVFGVESAKQMSGAEVSAILDWLNLDKDENTGEYIPAPIPIQECQAIHRQALIDGGQLEFEMAPTDSERLLELAAEPAPGPPASPIEAVAEALSPATLKYRQTGSGKLDRDIEAIQTIGDLYNACHEDFGLTKPKVLKEAGVSRQEDLVDHPREIYRQIAAVMHGADNWA